MGIDCLRNTRAALLFASNMSPVINFRRSFWPTDGVYWTADLRMLARFYIVLLTF